MRTVTRGARALLRNGARSGLLAALLTISISLTLVMITVDSAFGKRMDEIKNNVGSEVTVSTTNGFGGGFFRGGAPATGNDGSNATDGTTDDLTLTNDQATSISGIEHVISLTGELTIFDLDSTLVAPEVTLPEGVNRPEGSPNFQARLNARGTSDPNSILSTTGNGTTLADGRIFTADESDANVAVISEGLAEANSLDVGSTFTIGDTSIEVIGITTGGQTFGNAASITLPLSTAQRVSGQTDDLTTITLQVDDISNVEAVAATVSQTLGSDYNVTTSLDQYDQISGTLEDAQHSSRLALIVSALSAALVILFGILLAARQRIKEIGVMKAIGASNRQVVAQFGVETLAIGLVAGILGSVITFPIAQKVADGLVSSGNGGGPNFGGGGQAFFNAAGEARGGFGGGGGLIGSVNVAVSPMIFVYALLFAALLALIASIGPAWQVAHVRPAEVLRHE